MDIGMLADIQLLLLKPVLADTDNASIISCIPKSTVGFSLHA